MASRQIFELSADALFERWGNHVATIADETLLTLQCRARFRALDRMFVRNKRLAANGHDASWWFAHMWSTQALMFIRREMDDQAGVINLRHLLHELEARPDALYREQFMEWARLGRRIWCCWYHHRDEEREARAMFESVPLVRVPSPYRDDDDDGFDFICPKGVAVDRRALENDTREAFQYAQLMVAHRTPKDLDITFEAIDAALDAIDRMVRKYFMLLNGEFLTPRKVRLPKGFQEPFRHAWHQDGRLHAAS